MEGNKMDTKLKSILNHEVVIEVLETIIEEERYTETEYLITRIEATIKRYKELNGKD